MHPSYGPNARPSQDACGGNAPLRHAPFEATEMAPTVNKGAILEDTNQFRLMPRRVITDSYHAILA
jgi:hypothetical protein